MRIAFVLLFLLCGGGVFCAESQPPAPSRGEKIEHPDTNTQKTKETTDQLKVCTESLAAINKLLDAQGQEKAANKTTPHHKEESITEWWKIPDIWVAIFTGTLAVITGFLAYFTLMLWRATKTMVDEASITSKRQATQTEDALEISREAANAATEQAKTSTDALQRSNRAWIGLMGPVEIITPLTFGKDEVCCKIRLTVKNVGTSPALNTCLTYKFIVGPFPHPDPRTYIATIDQGFLQTVTKEMGITIIPGDPVQWNTFEAKAPLTGKQSDVSVWLNGYFGYKDEFGSIHASSFLYCFATHNGEKRIFPDKIVKGSFERFGSGWVNT